MHGKRHRSVSTEGYASLLQRRCKFTSIDTIYITILLSRFWYYVRHWGTPPFPRVYFDGNISQKPISIYLVSAPAEAGEQ